MPEIYFVDCSNSEYVQRELGNLCSNLNNAGIEADWFNRVEQAPANSILLVHDPVAEERIPSRSKVLGQRTLNRRQRLVLAEDCGLPVPRWCSLDSQDDIEMLFDDWGVENIIYKADWSYSRGGVRLLQRDDLSPFNKFNPDADVFMQILDGSPHTYKIDIFFDQVIACRKLLVRSVFDSKFYRSFTGASEQSGVPSLQENLKVLGRELFNYGVGLTNVDVMFDADDNPWVIELNTCSVGREANWMRWPDIYIPGYTRGICRWVAEGCPARYGKDVESAVGKLTARAGGMDHCEIPA